MDIVRAKNIVKEYRIGEVRTLAVNGIDFTVREKDFIAIKGKSGSGKSTLLHQLSLLDVPTSGEIFINEKSALNFSEKQKSRMRLELFGYVFQDYALVPELTALENVMLPLLMQGGDKKKCRETAQEKLVEVDLGNRLRNLPSQLSGGEKQRVSIARAIVNSPRILFADEPTANLDSETSKKIFELFTKLHRSGLTIVMVTHEVDYAEKAKHIITLKDGKIIDEKK